MGVAPACGSNSSSPSSPAAAVPVPAGTPVAAAGTSAVDLARTRHRPLPNPLLLSAPSVAAPAAPSTSPHASRPPSPSALSSLLPSPGVGNHCRSHPHPRTSSGQARGAQTASPHPRRAARAPVHAVDRVLSSDSVLLPVTHTAAAAVPASASAPDFGSSGSVPADSEGPAAAADMGSDVTAEASDYHSGYCSGYVSTPGPSKTVADAAPDVAYAQQTSVVHSTVDGTSSSAGLPRAGARGTEDVRAVIPSGPSRAGTGAVKVEEKETASEEPAQSKADAEMEATKSFDRPRTGAGAHIAGSGTAGAAADTPQAAAHTIALDTPPLAAALAAVVAARSRLRNDASSTTTPSSSLNAVQLRTQPPKDEDAVPLARCKTLACYDPQYWWRYWQPPADARARSGHQYGPCTRPTPFGRRPGSGPRSDAACNPSPSRIVPFAG
ncbi:hypothetical protein BC939DRAFT_475612 [Gamsiella multidivaricata]|uniref:uncharacterized protein n=1 Tax=Gamsiella multidivaricata TaxID=101098 RepID=UPI00221E7833|nr:uncharacterized protein BC939DRAFT_475612 [Gamsiella multidivaricata]KAI7826930.1 hypothetical protein BC939DRAFT_475612 [Gamsiella multidivaricata]